MLFVESGDGELNPSTAHAKFPRQERMVFGTQKPVLCPMRAREKILIQFLPKTGRASIKTLRIDFSTQACFNAQPRPFKSSESLRFVIRFP